MSFQVGDTVRDINTPAQTGTIVRMHPLGVTDAMVVSMNDGPMHSSPKQQGFFGNACDELEIYSP